MVGTTEPNPLLFKLPTILAAVTEFVSMSRDFYKPLSLVLLLLSTPFLASAAPAVPQVAPDIPLSAPVAEEISLEQLKRVLPAHPVVVGFDVDDTLVFSAPAFNALQPQYDAAVIRPKSYATLSPEQKGKYHEFWNRLNEEYDDRSRPKGIGKALLGLHLARGDDIWIISRRQATVPATETATKRIERFFGISLKHPVIVTNLQDKTPFITEHKIEYYYGDSDSDITAAVTAGATPIRVKRAADSYAKDVPHNGQLNELVLKDSER